MRLQSLSGFGEDKYSIVLLPGVKLPAYGSGPCCEDLQLQIKQYVSDIFN